MLRGVGGPATAHAWPQTEFIYAVAAGKNAIQTAAGRKLVLVGKSEPGVGEVAGQGG